MVVVGPRSSTYSEKAISFELESIISLTIAFLFCSFFFLFLRCLLGYAAHVGAPRSAKELLREIVQGKEFAVCVGMRAKGRPEPYTDKDFQSGTDKDFESGTDKNSQSGTDKNSQSGKNTSQHFYFHLKFLSPQKLYQSTQCKLYVVMDMLLELDSLVIS